MRYELAPGTTNSVTVDSTDHVEIRYNNDAPLTGDSTTGDIYEYMVDTPSDTGIGVSVRRTSNADAPVTLTIDDRGRATGRTWPDIAVHVIPTVQLLLTELVVQGPVMALPLPDVDVAVGAEWTTLNDIPVPWTTPQCRDLLPAGRADAGSDHRLGRCRHHHSRDRADLRGRGGPITGQFSIRGEMVSSLGQLGATGELTVEGILRISNNRGERYEVNLSSAQTYS